MDIPTTFSTLLPTLVIACLFESQRPSGYEMVSGSFIYMSLMTYGIENLPAC